MPNNHTSVLQGHITKNDGGGIALLRRGLETETSMKEESDYLKIW